MLPVLALQSPVEPTLTITVLEFVCATVVTFLLAQPAFKVLLAVPTLSKMLTVHANVLQVTPTTTEFALNVLLEPSGAQHLKHASLSVVRTQSIRPRPALASV